MYTRANPPKAFELDRAKVLPFDDIDPFIFTPPGGFLEDVTNYVLGYETTNAFSFWTGVHYLSSILKRDIWMPWGTQRHYPNFYIILLGYPGVVKKSTTMKVLSPVYVASLEEITNPALKWRKKEELVISSTATANGMFKLLGESTNNINKSFEDADGNPMELLSDANIILRVSELTTLLSKAQYNATLIDKVTDFYDCNDRDSSTTVAHGHLDLTNIYCTMLGATTPSSFQSSMTQEAYGGGFMSRCIVVKESSGYRRYPLPAVFPGVPDQVEMAKRLAYIAEFATGEYRLTGEAYDTYASWYIRFKEELQGQDPEEILHQDNRRDINVLKLSLILAAQRYGGKREISQEDVEASIRILDFTLRRAEKDVMRSALNPDTMLAQKILAIIGKKGKIGIGKSELLRNHQRLVNSRQLNDILMNLFEADMIEVCELTTGRPKTEFTGTRELYRFKRDK